MEESGGLSVTVTGLTPSKHISQRYYAELSNGSYLPVSVALIADFSLYAGRELTAEEAEELKASSGLYLAKSKALRLVENRPMSRSELRRKLIEKGIDDANADLAVDYIESIGAINDEEYAGMIVRHYSAKGYGAGRIKSELYRRGIDKDLWEDALEELGDTSETLDGLVASRLDSRGTDRKEIKKLTDFLNRRGFGWDEIRAAVNRYLENTEEF